MKGIVRSVEAMLAIMLLFISLSSFFRIEEETAVPISRYQRLVEETLEIYGDTYGTLVFDRPAEVEPFTRGVLPDYVNFRAEIEYLQPLDFFWGSSETNVPVTFYVDYPVGTDTDTFSVYDGRDSLPVQKEFNWFRVPFFVDNDATPRLGYLVNVTAELPFKDTNLDGRVEPVDPRSVEVFYESERQGFDFDVMELGEESVTVSVVFETDLEADELASGYIYYMAGDVYEG